MALAYLFPGQGSQERGMGAPLFDAFPALLERAERVLSWSVRDLCLYDSSGRLGQTQFTQPALYVVNALSWYAARRDGQPAPDFLAGHSLGEYNALLAAEVFDFETGLQLVRKRGELMSRAPSGGMAAVVGLPFERLREIIGGSEATDIDIANRNAPLQTVLSGPGASLDRWLPVLESAGARIRRLNVSAAFHSRYMADAAHEFERYLEGWNFQRPRIPVIANLSARPYGDDIQGHLGRQIRSSVRWAQAMQYLMAAGVDKVVELGPGRVLTTLFHQVRRDTDPRDIEMLLEEQVSESSSPPVKHSVSVQNPTHEASPHHNPGPHANATISSQRASMDGNPTQAQAESLGSPAFRQNYGVRYAYASGSMYKGIASRQLVARMANARLLAFLGTGGMSLDQVDEDIRWIMEQIPRGQTFGMNMLANYESTEAEIQLANLYLRHAVPVVEASAFMQVTPGVALYRFKGATKSSDGSPRTKNRLMAKVSRPEVAQAFMQPAPPRVLARLLESRLLSAEEVEVAKSLPVASDITVEADSAGHTDRGNPYTLMPAMLALRDQIQSEHNYPEPIRLGAAGGIGSPAAASAAFLLGADYVVTGSINQCTPESGTTEPVKELLADINVQDTDYAPAGDLFEMGSIVQVVKRGLFFPARANKLREIYQRHGGLDELDRSTRTMLENKYFRRSLEDVWAETADYLARTRPKDLEKAERNPKQKMACVFKWYFGHTTRLAMDGDETQKVDFQIHCGPAMGAFNQVVKGTALEPWRARHVDDIAAFIMEGASDVVHGFQTRTDPSSIHQPTEAKVL